MSIPINNSHKLFYKCYRISKKNFSVYKKSKVSSTRVFFKAIYQRFQRFFHNSSSHMVDHSERNNVVDYNYEPEGYFQQYAMQYYIDRIFLVVYAPAKLQGPQIFFYPRRHPYSTQTRCWTFLTPFPLLQIFYLVKQAFF